MKIKLDNEVGLMIFEEITLEDLRVVVQSLLPNGTIKYIKGICKHEQKPDVMSALLSSKSCRYDIVARIREVGNRYDVTLVFNNTEELSKYITQIKLEIGVLNHG